MAAAVIAGTCRLVAGARVIWNGDPPDGAPTVYFANHTSHLDFVVIWSALPASIRLLTRPVAAREYWERGWLRRRLASGVFRAVLVDRHATAGSVRREQFARLVEALESGDSLILFPEGTRGSGEEIAPFRSGLFHLGRRLTDVPLVPVHLDNLNRVLPKGEILPVPLLSRIIFGPSIRVGADETRQDFLDRAREAVAAARDA